MSLGETFRLARTEKGLTIAQVADATRIMVQIVEDLERDDFRRIAAPIYGRGFIKLYADLLGLPTEPLIREFMELYTGSRSPQVVRRSVDGVVPAPESDGEPETAPADPGEEPAARGAELPASVPSAPVASVPVEPDLFSLAAGRSKAVGSVADPTQPGASSPPRVRPASAPREERKSDLAPPERRRPADRLGNWRRDLRGRLPPGWTLPQAGAAVGIALLALLLLGLGIRALYRAMHAHPSRPSNIRVERVYPPPAPYFE
jgi:transcriptional regulator with XRE-family HTH domain